MRHKLAGKLLYVYEAWLGDTPYLKDRLSRVERAGWSASASAALVIETYALDLLEGPKFEVLDRRPPLELVGRSRSLMRRRDGYVDPSWDARPATARR